MKTRILLFFVIFLFANCIQSSKFDQEKWRAREDGMYVYRNEMADDLTKNRQLVGLTYNQLISFLGTPQFEDSTRISYEILVDYGRDIDPVHTKYLTLSMTKDSMISSIAVDEWKK